MSTPTISTKKLAAKKAAPAKKAAAKKAVPAKKAAPAKAPPKNSKVSWIRRNGESAVGKVVSTAERANGLWVNVMAEDQKSMNSVRVSELTRL